MVEAGGQPEADHTRDLVVISGWERSRGEDSGGEESEIQGLGNQPPRNAGQHQGTGSRACPPVWDPPQRMPAICT